MLSHAKIYRWPSTILPERLVAAGLLQLGRFPWFTRLRGVRGMHGAWQKRFCYLADTLQHVDKIVAASAFLCGKLIEYGAPAERVRQLTYGLDTSWVTNNDGYEPSSKLIVGFIGQILPMKGLDLLLKACRGLSSDLPVEIRVYGSLEKDPAYGYRIRTLAASNSRIKLLGVFKNADIGKILDELDVLVVPSIWYDFPLVIPSAFASKTPVIVTDLPGMNEMVEDQVDGLLFPRKDWRRLSSLLRQIAEEPSLLARLRAGIKPVKTLDEMAAEYSEIYRELTSAY